MSEDEKFEIPLQDQRVFGAGIKRKHVKFVPSTASTSPLPPPRNTSANSVSDLYLKLVLPGVRSTTVQETPLISVSKSPADSADRIEAIPGDSANTQVCEICNLPLILAQETVSIPEDIPPFESSNLHLRKQRPHEASLAHQVCLAHSHPPSHLDRNRKGLAYLSAYGWDPDARLGLGASGQGIQYPIKTKPKDDKLGIGVVLPKKGEIVKKEKQVKLDARKIRKLQEKDKRKGERLKQMFYQNDDVERYLGGS